MYQQYSILSYIHMHTPPPPPAKCRSLEYFSHIYMVKYRGACSHILSITAKLSICTVFSWMAELYHQWCQQSTLQLNVGRSLCCTPIFRIVLSRLSPHYEDSAKRPHLSVRTVPHVPPQCEDSATCPTSV
jgi:hypothetical protein